MAQEFASAYVADGAIECGFHIEPGERVETQRLLGALSETELAQLIKSGALVVPVAAQSPTETQAELDALRQRVAELEASLKSEAGEPAASEATSGEPAESTETDQQSEA